MKSVNDIRNQYGRIRTSAGYGNDDPLYSGNRRLNYTYNGIVERYVRNIEDTDPRIRELRSQIKAEALSPNRDGGRIRQLNARLERITNRLYQRRFPRSVYAKAGNVRNDV